MFIFWREDVLIQDVSYFLVIVSALRDPRTVLWNSGRYNKAMAHFQTMQELFDESRLSYRKKY